MNSGSHPSAQHRMRSDIANSYTSIKPRINRLMSNKGNTIVIVGQAYRLKPIPRKNDPVCFSCKLLGREQVFGPFCIASHETGLA